VSISTHISTFTEHDAEKSVTIDTMHTHLYMVWVLSETSQMISSTNTLSTDKQATNIYYSLFTYKVLILIFIH